MKESDLILHLKNDDRHAFDTIYSMYAPRLMSFCLSYVRITEDAEEIIQDIFISLWKNRATIQITESLSPFLSGALRNKILYYFRRKLNSPIYEQFIDIRDEILPVDQQTGIEYEEFRRIILTEINGLPRSQKDAILLSKFQGLSNKEISERLGLNIQTVKNSLSLGLKNLRRRLSKYPDIFPLTPLILCSAHIHSIII